MLVNQISARWFGFCRVNGVNGLKFTCKFQERCQIPAISAPGSEAAQHQTTISLTKTWHVWLNQEVEGIGAWMLEWSEQFSMATWLSSHKEKQVRQDHAGHVDSADVSLPFLLICKICFLYFAFDRCEHVLQSCLTVLQSCSTVKNCGFYARSGRRWRSLLCCQRRSHICCKESARVKHCLWMLCHSLPCISTLPPTFWNQRCVHHVFLVRKVFSQFCLLVLPCLGLFCALFVFTVEAFNTKDEKRQRMK